VWTVSTAVAGATDDGLSLSVAWIAGAVAAVIVIIILVIVILLVVSRRLKRSRRSDQEFLSWGAFTPEGARGIFSRGGVEVEVGCTRRGSNCSRI